MGTDRYEDTISLWSDESQRAVTLKDLQTKKEFRFVIKHSFVIGRNKEACNLQITTDDLYISGVHLRLINENGGIYAEDLHSKNGTKINGRQVSSKTRIRPGDILRIGRSEYEVLF